MPALEMRKALEAHLVGGGDGLSLFCWFPSSRDRLLVYLSVTVPCVLKCVQRTFWQSSSALLFSQRALLSGIRL